MTTNNVLRHAAPYWNAGVLLVDLNTQQRKFYRRIILNGGLKVPERRILQASHGTPPPPP